MRRRATISALLLVGVGVVLGTTVFRADLAEATGLAQSVTVNNTTNNPVPVKEQNLDGQNIRVHEEGTANVQPKTADASDWYGVETGALSHEHVLSGGPIFASLIVVNLDPQVRSVDFRDGNKVVLLLPGPAEAFGQGQLHYILPLTQPLKVDRWVVICGTQLGCGVTVNVVGVAAS
jgi:hypothetical protein